MENAQKFQFPDGLKRRKENKELRQNVDSRWDDAENGALLWGPFISAIPSLQVFNRLLTSPEEFRANVGCIADFMQVVGAYAHCHEGHLVCRIVSVTLNLAWAAVESCRQEPSWSAVADDLAFRAACMIERHDKCCCLRNEPGHLFDGTSRVDGDPLFPGNVGECQEEITRLKTETEKRRRPIRRARDIARIALEGAWRDLRHYQQEFEYVSRDELVVSKQMPDSIRSLSAIGLAVFVFIRTMIGRQDIEPIDTDLLLNEDGYLGNLVFGDEDAPSALERAQRAECLARIFEARVQAAIAIDKTSFWKTFKASRHWEVLGHQAIAYAQALESHWEWIVPLICHRPDRPLDERTVNDVWHIKRMGDAAENYAKCFEAQVLLSPRGDIKLPPCPPVQRLPRPDTGKLVPATLPVILNEFGNLTPAEVRSSFLVQWGDDAREDNWLRQRGWLSQLPDAGTRLYPKMRLAGFATRGSGRGHQRRRKSGKGSKATAKS